MIVASLGVLATLGPYAYWRAGVVSDLAPAVPGLMGQWFNTQVLGALFAGAVAGLFGRRLPGWLLYLAGAAIGALMTQFVWVSEASLQNQLIVALVLTLFAVFFGSVAYIAGYVTQALWRRWRSA